MPLLLSLLRRHSYPPPPPPTAPDDAPKVVFTWLHDLKMADVGWDGIQSPVSSHLLKQKMEVYIQNYNEKKSTKYIA